MLFRPLLVITLVLGLAGCFPASRIEDTRRAGLVEVAPPVTSAASLRAFEYVSRTARPKPPLVVVLHHCFQNALNYFADSGWGPLADAHGLVLLMPEQRPENSALMCFDFTSEHRRGGGEPEAVRQMIERAIARHDIDRSRIFVTGMSAGGSMAVIMMALHPELFAGGGVFGSVPFGCPAGFGLAGCTGSVPERAAGVASLRDRVLAANPQGGPWPRLAVWTGSEDGLVHPSNAVAIARQWIGLFGLAENPFTDSTTGPVRRRLYRDRTGRSVVELNVVAGIGHALPVDKAGGCGAPTSQAFNLTADIGLCSSLSLLRFWGLAP